MLKNFQSGDKGLHESHVLMVNMLEPQGMQHIFIMSSAIEKMQHVLMHQSELRDRHMTDASIQIYEQKKAEVQDAGEVSELNIFEREKERRGRYRKADAAPKKNNRMSDNEIEDRELNKYIHKGKNVNIIV